jgi:hypothetical protein
MSITVSATIDPRKMSTGTGKVRHVADSNFILPARLAILLYLQLTFSVESNSYWPNRMGIPPRRHDRYSSLRAIAKTRTVAVNTNATHFEQESVRSISYSIRYLHSF